ncbi:stage V sporulation protein AE [Niallia endozanthoxylica]|uniref:Stage V sporulation protein AE n=1 Tax=Niallia endozanthoxylica TaxID=2036016 RepID=A0A5J5HWV5_9BACI|nr:stage V sporulation protein AE [Niallia endozanthoxylica]KAA9026183.1 stage V sporulation protein AE [Niallia endozanthoxylica]
MEGAKRRVILITDGDKYARKSLEIVAKEIGGRCLSVSNGNPSRLDGSTIVKQIKKVVYDPVLVMFDDSGFIGEGAGEKALRYVAAHEDIEILGIIAVASNPRHEEWTKVDVCIDRDGEITANGVDKYGIQELEVGKLYGDTVYCLDELNVPLIVGIGDIGKMAGKDHFEKGSPITRKAVELILERSGYDGGRNKRQKTDS